ncbi:Gfo/Idh/MocA family protein [Ovoidimarina sediminis]|uniref:Gfo/Idh/MocA family protein n=1 Tax=Ovoidimarina sediminis TaxID=3079856 RepID=UPI00291222E7|nr:Gfo/Idh/MocA family oxidoreductase [Rhodophyticola sp. MJ-SS7]MDU8942107.1 Gfo/Idh/MocA family oxidoreductase [Rhodophyticola sp. MJ-SS7]
MRRKGIAVVGAGLIGRRHAGLIARHDHLAAIVDPAPEARAVAEDLDVPWADDLPTFFAAGAPDGLVIATPNQLHASHAHLAISAGCPILIEKPITDSSVSGAEVVRAARDNGVPILVGHHRRHNPIIAAVKDAIDGGAIGRIVAVHGQFWLYKPEEYFVPSWRRRSGAGPIFINLIHDIDLLRYLCGEIVRVTAAQSNTARGHDVEDSAAVLIEFESGALGTFSVSDTVSAPWSWEFTSGENPAYPRCDTSAYAIGGTHGSISVPDLMLWLHPRKRGWWEPMEGRRIEVVSEDPLVRQIQHFREVIEGRASPLVSGEEGLRTLRVIEAIKHSAEERRGVDLIY